MGRARSPHLVITRAGHLELGGSSVFSWEGLFLSHFVDTESQRS